MSRELCTWCGHAPHPHPCPRTIETTEPGAKRATIIDCPCARAREQDEQRRSHGDSA